MAKPTVSADEAIKGFVATLAEHAAKQAKTDLGQFRDWSERNGYPVVAAHQIHLDQYKRHLLDSDLAPMTMTNKLGVIRRFFDYLVEARILKRTPVEDGWVPRSDTKRRIEEALTPDEMSRFIRAAERSSPRLKAAVYCFCSGLRGKDFLRLDVEDVEISNGSVRLPERGSPLYRLRLSKPASDALIKYLDGRTTGPLFTTSTGHRLTRNQVAKELRALGAEVGLSLAISPTVLFNSAVVAMLDSGLPPELISSYLGDLTRGQRLLDGAVEALERRGDSASPRAVALDVLAQALMLLGEQNVNVVAPIVLAGAALESLLRAMTKAEGLPIKGQASIGEYGDALRRADLITVQQRKELEVLGGLRNAAAHGSFASLGAAEARRMTQGVTDLIEALA